MQNLNATNELLNITLGITASPVVQFEKTKPVGTPVPNLSPASPAGGFTVYLDAALSYDSLSRVVNGYLAGKRFEVTEGLFARHIVVKEVTLAGNMDGNLLIKLDFSGSFHGTAFFTGKPHYNAESQTLEVENLAYDLQTKNLLLKGAKWLFAAKIENELKKASQIPLGSYFDAAKLSLTQSLNREWTKGVNGTGAINDLRLVSAEARPAHLFLRTACTGKLQINISEIDLGL